MNRLLLIRLLFPLLLLPALAACGSASTTPSAPATVQEATAKVRGHSELVLVNSQGRTLYYLSSDTPTASTCTGACASLWPPLLQPSGTPTLAPGISGSLQVIQDPNGAQVTYNGHPLYTFAGDTKAGEVRGDGLPQVFPSGPPAVWHVAKPGL